MMNLVAATHLDERQQRDGSGIAGCCAFACAVDFLDGVVMTVAPSEAGLAGGSVGDDATGSHRRAN